MFWQFCAGRQKRSREGLIPSARAGWQVVNCGGGDDLERYRVKWGETNKWHKHSAFRFDRVAALSFWCYELRWVNAVDSDFRMEGWSLWCSGAGHSVTPRGWLFMTGWPWTFSCEDVEMFAFLMAPNLCWTPTQSKTVVKLWTDTNH